MATATRTRIGDYGYEVTVTIHRGHEELPDEVEFTGRDPEQPCEIMQVKVLGVSAAGMREAARFASNLIRKDCLEMLEECLVECPADFDRYCTR